MKGIDVNIAVKLSVIVTASLVAAGLSALPAAAQTTTTTAPTSTLSAEGSQIVTQSGRIVDFYKTMGVTQADVPTATDAQTSTLNGVIDIVAGSTMPGVPALPTLSSQPTDCSNTGALISYSQQVAAENSAIDPNATTPDQETVYMYLSHFFDLPSICADNTAYYPDWIVNDDRSVYDSYLSASNNSTLVSSFGKMAVSANTLAGDPVTSANKIWRGGYGDKLAGATNVADQTTASSTLITELQTVSTLLNANDTPQQVVDQMRSDLSPEWTATDVVDTIIGTAALLMEPEIGVMVFGLGLTAVSMQLTGLNTIMQTAAFNAMRASTSGRVSERLMRSYGL